MKHFPGFTDFFMSPVTGRIILPMIPDLYHNYVWLGDRNDRPLPSPIIIDLRLEIIDIRRRLSSTRFILQAASPNFDSSQALNELVPGILKHDEGIVSIAFPWVDYVPPILPEKNIWIGNEDDFPEPYERIFLENLPSMLSDNPELLDGAYNLYRGSPDPETLGIPEIVKTLHITNMADLTVGHLWLGTNSIDPLNFGANRPVEIIILPLANMANLPEGKIWVGNSEDRPEPSDALTGIQIDIDSIFDHLLEIDIHLGDIDISIGDININIESLIELVSDISVDFGDIIIRLDGLDGTVLDLQGQIDTNVASGLDHLADLQLQIDTNVASGLDALATINATLTSILSDITSIFSSLSTITSSIASIVSDIATINTTITTIQTAITTINTTITSILTDITTLFSDIVTINASITSILSSISTINTAITTIQSSITTINASITTINTTLTSLQTQINTINTTITTIQGDITNITTVLLPAVYTYIDTEITNITNNFIAGGVIDMDDNRIINLPCDPVEDNDAVSFCFLWHSLHDEVNATW